MPASADQAALAAPAAVAVPAPVLRVRRLDVEFNTEAGVVPAVRGLSYEVHPGEVLAIVGESGSGKSVSSLAVMGLLPGNARIGAESIEFDGIELLGIDAAQMRRLRGRGLAMIFQDPMTALNPVMTVGQQLEEPLRQHLGMNARQARERALELLALVGIPDAATRIDQYPHQFSGGMRQRVMIAMALICEPKLLIADEPTTALDVTVQAQITDLLRELSDRAGTALMFITHDLGVVAEVCTRMVTMYAGEIVEDAPVDDALTRPRHPYTSGLLRSLPRLAKHREALPSIRGRVPSPSEMPPGCRFRARCDHALPACAGEQVAAEVSPGHQARCMRAVDLQLPGVVA